MRLQMFPASFSWRHAVGAMIVGMKKDKKMDGAHWAAKVLASAFLLGILGGCGTFFPSQSAQRAADKVLDDILPTKSTDETPRKETNTADAKKP